MESRIIFVIVMLLTGSSLRAAPPNILFVLIDDMGYRDLSCFGGTRAKTPAIDKLAAEGMRFTQFYVASPICSPSRCALITGQYPGRWRITSFLASREEDEKRGLADWLDPKAPSVARMLSEAGYYTSHVGKWHLGGQRDVGDAPPITAYGFETSLTNFEGLGERMIPKFTSGNGKPLRHGPSDMNAALGGGPIHFVERPAVTARYVDRAIHEMKHADEAGRPFFINLWLDDVHSPMQPAANSPDLSPADRYLAVLREMDRELDRIFDFVRGDEKLRANTLIVLASDNGHEPGLGSAGDLRGAKGQLYEGGIRSPLIVWWPGEMPNDAIGTSNDTTLIAGIDLCPSLVALAGATVPADVKLDGLDLSDALAGRFKPRRESPVMWVRPPDRPGPRGLLPDLAIRAGDWKLLVERDGSSAELFNVVEDPNEQHNRASDHPDKVKQLSTQVIEWDVTTNRQ